MEVTPSWWPFRCVDPYNAQKQLIKRYLEAKPSVHAEVLTFDSSQGKEFDIVFISLVRTVCPQQNNVGFRFLNNPQAACVALSRAREVLMVIGKCTTIARECEVWRGCLSAMYRGYQQSRPGFAFLEPQLRGADMLLVKKTDIPAML